jgi:hypothetical protein
MLQIVGEGSSLPSGREGVECRSSSAFSVVLNSLIQVQAFQPFVAKDLCA